MARRRSHQQTNTPRVLAIIGVAALSLVVVILAVVALNPQTPPAASESRYTPAAEAVITPEAPTVELPAALFIGDSYTHGTGASDKSLRWSTLVAGAEGWTELNEALGGTGYLTTSGKNGCGRDFCPNYTDAMKELSLAAETVVIAGGQNDFGAWNDDPQPVKDAIWSAYTTARTLYPSARIIAVGPSQIGTVSDAAYGIDAEVQAAAASIGAEYVSMIDPDVIDPSMDSGDGGHVNDVGHRAIADRFLAAFPASS